MADTPEPGWPKLPNGAIDWETAFEDSTAGLIPLILGARTPAALRQCMIAVVTKLYVRKEDPSEVERFVAQLTAMIPDQASPRQIARVADTMVVILRRIKADRVRVSAAVKAAKVAAPSPVPAVVADAPAPVEDRRSKSERVSLAALAKEAVARRLRKIALVVGGIAAALAIASIMISTYMAGAPQREEKRKATLLLEQIQAVSHGKIIEAHAYGGALRADTVGGRAAVVVEGLPVNSCVNAGWVLVNKGTIMINGVIPVTTSLNWLSALCANNPEGATLTWIPRGTR